MHLSEHISAMKRCMNVCVGSPDSQPSKVSCGLVHYFAISSLLKIIGALGYDDEESVSGKAEGTTASLPNFAIRTVRKD